MTNQRPGKVIRASKPEASGMISIARLIEFCNEAARILKESDDESSAYYFEQLEEYLRRYPERGLEAESVARILGI